MKTEIKELWVAALRSDKYRQVCGALRIEGEGFVLGHCCLGVLTDLYRKEKKKGWHKTVGHVGEGLLPKVVGEWAGMDTTRSDWEQGSYVNAKGEEKMLTVLNDSANLSFKQIANVIDAVYKRL